MRLFFALWPPRQAALALERWTRSLAGRATPVDKIHLTLAFLGEGEASRAIAAASRIHESAFRLPLEEARYWRHNRIVWAGPREVPAGLAGLAERLQIELYRESFILERRPFAAHVTLLREAPAQAIPELPSVEWPVSEFALVRSAGGAYETLERFALS